MPLTNSLPVSPSLDAKIATLAQEITTFHTLCAQADSDQLTNEQVIILRAQDHAIQAQFDLIVGYLATHAIEQAA